MKRTFLTIIFLVVVTNIFSQNFLLKINNQQVSSSEFEKLYLKNPNQAKLTEADFDDYLDLFINYKLKVLEAYNLRYDTIKSIKDEHYTYVKQLSEPFFTNKEYENKLLVEAYERSKKEVRLSYILIKAEPLDTLKAYNKAMDIYNRLMKKENFDKLAVEFSEANNIKQDGADAWYNKVFWMPYQMENFAFTGKVGDISKPILANNAYFILKITDIRTGLPKEVRASHIYLGLRMGSSLQDSIEVFKKIDTIKKELKKGVSFDELAMRFSDDKQNAAKGGDLGWFTTGKMFKDFENAVYSIKNIGDWVGPIRTPAGYHFIKLTDVKYLGTFEQEKDNLLKQLQKNSRYNLVKESVFDNLKNIYNYQQVGKLDEFYTKVDSSIIQSKWVNNYFTNDNNLLMKFADKTFTNSDFAKYLEKNQKNFKDFDIIKIINKAFDQFVKDMLKDYEIEQLPQKDKEFGELMMEYYQGLMLFEITNNQVWQKASKDTLGLMEFFKQNRKNYTQRISFSTFQYKDPKTYKKLINLLNQKVVKNLSDSSIVKEINAKKELIKFSTCICKLGENEDVDYIADQITKGNVSFDQNILENKEKQKVYWLYDSFPYVKGLVIADYQEVLMDKWIEYLRKKYTVEINQAEWNKLKSKYLK